MTRSAKKLVHDEQGRLIKTGPGGPALEAYALGLSISGGGHRAALFGLGVLMAMRDAGRLPEEISSVSGGSITNAVLAAKYFSRVPEDRQAADELWQSVTRELFDTIVLKGSLTTGWLWFLGACLFAPPVAFMILAAGGWLPGWPVVLAAFLVWAPLVLLRGLLIERLMAVRYFGKSEAHISLSDISQSPIEHVICSTDLVTGRPLYVSSRECGEIYRRVDDIALGIGPRTVMPAAEAQDVSNVGVTYKASELRLAAAVRASAAFPGIPPRRIQLGRYEKEPGGSPNSARIPSIAFLSDGGIWSNLATQPFEDGFLWGTYGPWIVLVADASAPNDVSSPFKFHVPLVAEILALVRQVVVQNENTVGPRRRDYQRWMRLELSLPRTARFLVERLYPVVSLAETPEKIRDRIEAAVGGDTPNDLLSYHGKDPQSEAERRAKTSVRLRSLEAPGPATSRLDNTESINTSENENFAILCHLAQNRAAHPTTLNRIDRAKALAIVGRGYANAAVTMYLTCLTEKLVVPNGWLQEE